MPIARGTRFGSYEIGEVLGAGGMGEVYRARDTKLHRDVAVKVLPASVAHDPDRIARFAHEAQVLASLNHPNIAAIYGVEENGGQRALVMELAPGEELEPPSVPGYLVGGHPELVAKYWRILSDEAGGVTAAERLRAAIADLPVVDSTGSFIPVTASIGLAAFRAGDGVDSLIRRADEAMYVAKKAGRNRVAVAPGGEPPTRAHDPPHNGEAAPPLTE